jgi:solute carrier family 25 protein 33/36
VTSPLDVLRTRLQSDFYQTQNQTNHSLQTPHPRHGSNHKTIRIINSIYRAEGWRAFFRGLGPSVAGVVPATAIKFYVYGNCKHLGAKLLGRAEDSPLVHAQAAICAGLATSTATNPIWLVKTRLQLDKSQTHASGPSTRQYRNSIDCIRQTLRNEGVRGFYRGMSASYLGSIETALHLVLYERLKTGFRESLKPMEGTGTPFWEELSHWLSTSGAASSAKLVAGLITYPHEVRCFTPTFWSLTNITRLCEHDCARHQWRTDGPNIRAWYNASVPSPKKKVWLAYTEALPLI